MVCPDVFEMLYLDAVVKHQLQGFGADSLVPIRLSYPVAHLAVVFADTGMLNKCSQLVGGDKDMVKVFKYK